MNKLIVTTAIIAISASAAHAQSNFYDSIGDISAWKGSVEGGLDKKDGNTELTDYYLNGKISHDSMDWKHTLSGSAYNSKTAKTRTEEKYRATWQSDYKFTDKTFGFFRLEGTKDRFSGYDYRFNESVGIGHKFIDDDKIYLEGRAGVGAEHTKLNNGDKSDLFLGNLGGDFRYNFNENVSFSQTLEGIFTEDLNTYRSETSIKSKVSDGIAFKAGYRVEKLSEVPAGRKKTDAHTFIGLVYDF